MNLTVQRRLYSQRSTIGSLAVNGEFFCFTLEPPKRSDDIKPRAIPVGTYDVGITFSSKHKCMVPYVSNVPGFEGIEIHPGNKPEDTLGCLLVGFIRGPADDWIGDSRDAFGKLFPQIKEALENGPVYITYLD